MRLFTSVLFVVPSVFAYQITSPGGTNGWNTTGPNILTWNHVTTDPLNFTGVLTNVNSGNTQVLDAFVDGTLNIVTCSAPQGGWPSGSGFRVNLAQDPAHLNTILAQSDQFNITAVSSNGSTTSSASTQTTASVVATSSGASLSSSQTGTTPTGVSAASLRADARAGSLAAVAVLTAFIAALF